MRLKNLWGISFFPSLISLANFAFSSSDLYSDVVIEKWKEENIYGVEAQPQKKKQN